MGKVLYESTQDPVACAGGPDAARDLAASSVPKHAPPVAQSAADPPPGTPRLMAPGPEKERGKRRVAPTPPIRTYEVQYIPGLLQTADYMRAVMAGRGVLDGDSERRVKVRLERQNVLLREQDPPRLWAVVDEAALRRPVGSPEIMRQQLSHLLEMMERPNVTVQVLPFQSGAHAAEAGAFTILRFAEPDLPDVVYLEHLAGALYLDKRDDVDVYLQVIERISVTALTPALTAEALAKRIKDF